MHSTLPILLAASTTLPWLLGGLALVVFAVIVVLIAVKYFGIWFRAYMSSANISLLSLIGMSFRRVDARTIVLGKIMSVQAGIGSEKQTGVTTRRLEAHYLAIPDVSYDLGCKRHIPKIRFNSGNIHAINPTVPGKAGGEITRQNFNIMGKGQVLTYLPDEIFCTPDMRVIPGADFKDLHFAHHSLNLPKQYPNPTEARTGRVKRSG
jgi:hypothetical protein